MFVKMVNFRGPKPVVHGSLVGALLKVFDSLEFLSKIVLMNVHIYSHYTFKLFILTPLKMVQSLI